MRKLIIFLIFSIFYKGLYSYHEIGLEGSVRVIEESYLFKANDNKLKFYDGKNKFSLIVSIDKKDKDKSSITFIDHSEKYYILLTKREINSISNLKSLFLPKNKTKKSYQIREKGSIKNILNFKFKEYLSQNDLGEINLFFSKEMDAYLRKFITYDDFINFLRETDLSGIPFVDNYFDMVQYFINQSLELGFIGEIYLNKESLYSIINVKESTVKISEFEIPNTYEKRGIESFLGNF